MIKEKIKKDMILAMKNRETEKLNTIRAIMSKIKDHEIAIRSSSQKQEVNDTDVLKIMQKMIKQRQDSVIEYKKGNREDLADKEQREIVIIKSFMPELLGEQELNDIIKSFISINQVESIQDMGKVVNYIKEEYVGRIDPAVVAKKVKDILLQSN